MRGNSGLVSGCIPQRHLETTPVTVVPELSEYILADDLRDRVARHPTPRVLDDRLTDPYYPGGQLHLTDFDE